mgnify:CR=1 FL=1
MGLEPTTPHNESDVQPTASHRPWSVSWPINFVLTASILVLSSIVYHKADKEG